MLSEAQMLAIYRQTLQSQMALTEQIRRFQAQVTLHQLRQEHQAEMNQPRP